MTAMNAWAWVQLLSAVSGLTLALLAMSSGAGSRLAFPLALLALDQFAWNAASVGWELTGNDQYAWMGATAAPLFTPIAFHFVIGFLGMRQALRRWLGFVYGLFGIQAAAAAVQVLFFRESVLGLPALSSILLATSLPVALAALRLLARHLASAPTALERWRAKVLIGALVMVVLLMTTDLMADLGLPVPRLAALASFAFNVTMMLLTLRLGLFPNVPDRVGAVGQAAVIALFSAAAYLLLFMLFKGRVAVLITSATALSLCFAAAGWFFFIGAQRVHAGRERFVSLGRFSSQMAHDLRNPLAAARGAAEFLAEELRRSRQPQHRDFAMLIVHQLDRLGAVIDRYQRLSTMRPEFSQLDLNALVGRVLSLQAFGAAGVEFTQALAAPPVVVSADRDLLASALENMLKNAIEAMPRGGPLTVGTRLEAGDTTNVVLSVQDGGVGMDARAREQAFELFFTTKATGSGLGLAFVQQVARAHGGHVRLQSQEGAGTLLEVVLPLGSALPPGGDA
jgi:signal transduction histidine kinase